MARLLRYVVALAVLAGVACVPAALFDWSAGESVTAEPTSITGYVADFTVGADGDMQVIERLTVSFPTSDRHGIFRFFDRADDSAPRLRREPRELSVTMDGGPVPVELLEQDHRRYLVARIGDPGRYVTPGEHVYEIHYSVDDVLLDHGGGSRLYWNLVPDGWRQPIAQARLTVHLPAPAEGVRVAVGEDTGWQAVTGSGTPTVQVRTGALAPNTPVTIRTDLDLPAPEPEDEELWSPRWDRVLGPGLPLLLAVLAGALAAAWAGWVAGARAREPKPSYPLQYAPPEGLGPAQGAYLLTERTDREAYVATLMHAAEKGAVTLERHGDAWTITDRAGPEGWRGVDEVTRQVAQLLGGPGGTFRADPDDVQAGKVLKGEIEDFGARTRQWALTEGYLVRAGLGGVGGLLVLAAFALYAACVVWNPVSMSVVGLVPAAFAVFGSSMLRTGASTRRTARGRELWSRLGGFHRVLSTPSSKQRFDFAGREELYTAYLPWAVAWGCADTWAEKYRTETGAEAPVPSYLAFGHGGGSTGRMVDAMVEDFSATVDSAISSYEATQKSSSGGGGFSGGGGGGGGGGGSW